MLVAFAGVSLLARTLLWILRPAAWQVGGFVLLGVLQTIMLEWRATRLGLWQYTEAMPVVPFIDVGLVPLLQWIVLPLLVVWLTKRCLT